MRSDIKWTNKSVMAFAEGRDPVARMEERVKSTVLSAMDNGWRGPPFDPVSLARILGLNITPRQDIADARTIPTGDGLSIEFNPFRPRGRIRFSIAHEIAHSFFPDCAERVRNRGATHPGESADDWQLEILCNIGAAELLMPTGSFLSLAEADLDIHNLIAKRREFDVSMEALVIRTVKLTSASCAAFCASVEGESKQYRLDYVIPSRSWRADLRAGYILPSDTKIADANAIGFTLSGEEQWGKTHLWVQGIALAPYPGSVVPRVVGVLAAPNARPKKEPDIDFVIGDVLVPRGEGKKIIAHVVPDSVTKWGGGGVAAQLRKKHPQVADEFKAAIDKLPGGLVVGQHYKAKIDAATYVFTMVAQRGHGNDPARRIRYSSLTACLRELNKWAAEMGATVHMPQIGTGHGGGSWAVIHELVLEELVRKGTSVTVYKLP